MAKILIYSKTIKNIDKINRVLKSKNFALRVEKTFKNLPSAQDKTDLIILDITSGGTGSEDYIKNIAKAADRSNTAKFIILDPGQTKSLLENAVKFDDFIFSDRIEKELALRIKLIIANKKILIPKNSIAVNGLILNLDKYELSVNGKPIELTFKEFELLKLLLQHQDKVFSRNKLLSAVWEYDFYGGSRTVDVHIRRLRSKIPPPYNLMLKTVRNVGYMFSSQI